MAQRAILDAERIDVDGKLLRVQRAKFTVTGSGDQQVLAAVAGKKLRVLASRELVDAATTVTWKSDSTALTGAMPYPTEGGAVQPMTPHGWLETVAGEALKVALGTTTSTLTGNLVYLEI
ncbi:MAG: hypothetical protein N2C14_17250 [Planctomycetales bacterium]